MDDLINNEAGDELEQEIDELERRKIIRDNRELDDSPESNPLFEQPAKEKEGDLVPISAKQQGQLQTTGSNEFSDLREWAAMPKGPERDAAKARWTQKYYGMSPEQYDESGFFNKVYQGLKNMQPSFTSVPTAIGLGAIDFVGDVASVHPTLGAIDDWWDEKTKFTNPTLRRWRQFGNIVIPSMVGTGAVLNATRGQRLITQAAATLGVDLAVTGISEDQTNDESITKHLVETFPGQFGEGGRTPLPKALITTDSMSAVNRKLIHMLEATPFTLLGNTIGFLFSRGKPKLSWFKPLDKRAKRWKEIAIARSGANQTHVRIREIDQILKTKPNNKDIRILKEERKRLVNELAENNRFDQYVENVENSKQAQVDSAGSDKLRNPEFEYDVDVKPVQDGASTGYNSIPEGSAARNMAEVAAIKNGIAPSDGLPPPILTENARRKGLRVSGKESPSRTTIMDIEQQARAMGDFEIISDGIKWSRKSMDKAAEKIFIDIMEASNVDDVQKLFLSERSMVKFADDVSVQFATEPQARAAFWAIRELFDRYIGGPIARASARFMDTTGREIAATAQAMSEYGSELVDDIQLQDLILGKIQYLLTEWGINAKVGSAVLKLKDASSSGPGFVPADELIPHMLDQFKAIENGAHAKAVRFTKELRRLAVENPLAIKPLIHIFDYTNGDVDTLVKLMKWAENKVDIRGLIVSPEKGQMNYMAKGLWGVFFNNMLSGLAPLNALKGSATILINKPINQMMGSGLYGLWDNFDDFNKVIYYHQNVKETNKRALSWAWQVFKKVHKDPTSHLDALRADFVIKAKESEEILGEVADIWRAENDLGHLAQYNMASAFHKLYGMKWFRTGMTGMSFVDAMTDIHSATWISRLEAWEDVANTKGGVFTKEALAQAEKVNYSKKFDKNGILKDGPAKADAAEIKFNIDDNLAKSINNVTNQFPFMKHVAAFPRAVSNASKYTFSYTPIATIPGATKFADTIWAQSDDDIIKALARHNIDAKSTPHWKQIWRVKRHEYIGRLITGTLITRGLWEYALDGGINGPGHYNPSRRQREIRFYNYKPQTIRIPVPGKDNDVLMSYKGLPGIEFLLDMVGSMAYYAKDIEQPLYEDSFRKIAVTMALSLGDQTFFSGIDKLFDIINGNEAAAKQWLAQSIPIIPSSVKLLAKSIDGAYKNIYNDYTDYVQAQVPLASMSLYDVRSPWDGKPIGIGDNRIVEGILAFSPLKFYVEPDNTPIGKAQKILRELNYEGMTIINKDSSGKIEWDPEHQQFINEFIGKTEPHKDILKIANSPKYKYIIGKVRAFVAQGGDRDWEKFQFKEELLTIYDEFDRVWEKRRDAAEQALLIKYPELQSFIDTQKNIELNIKQGNIDEAVRIGNDRSKNVRQLLQMAK